MEDYTLVKLSDDMFNGDHPNGIINGYTTNGSPITELIIGQRFIIKGVEEYLNTSPVTEIVSETPNETIFKTLNSTYKLTKNK